MSIDPVKIPQNVYIEDRIIGPLTLRQIILMAIGGGISYAIFGSMQKAMGSVPIPLAVIAWIPAGIFAIFAIIKVNDLSIAKILLLLLESTQKPSKRSFGPRQGISINFRTVTKEPVEDPTKKKMTAAPVARTQEQFVALGSTMDRMWHEDEAAALASDEPMQQIQVDAKPELAPAEFVLPITTAQEPEKPKTTDSLSDLSLFRDIFPSPPSQ